MRITRSTGFTRRGISASVQDLGMATLDWVDWVNPQRLLGAIGNIPTANAEQTYSAQRDMLDMIK